MNTLARLAAFEQFHDAAEMQPDAKLALALSGWLLGSDAADTNLLVTLSLAEARNMIRNI